MVTGTTGHKFGTTPPSGPHTLGDRSGRLGGRTTPPRPGFSRSSHPLSWLGRAAKPELAAGHVRLLRAAAAPLLIVDLSLSVVLWVDRRVGLVMGHGMWIRVLGKVG